jgi:hypothetical protein
MRHVYAIVRIDGFLADLYSDVEPLITIKKIVWSQEEAEEEVERLNRLNEKKNCKYFWKLTRLEDNSSGIKMVDL